MSKKKLIPPQNTSASEDPPKPEQFREMVIDLRLMNLDLDPEPAIIDRLVEVVEQLPENVAKNLYQSMLVESRRSRNDVDEFLNTHRISKAESRLLASLAEGKTVVEHASSLRISVNTARTHMRRLLEKTGAKGQLDLVRMYLK